MNPIERRTRATGSIQIILDNVDRTVQRLATMVVNPRPVFVTIGETTKIPTLDVYRNCEREVSFGWPVNSLLFIFSHKRIYNLHLVDFK